MQITSIQTDWPEARGYNLQSDDIGNEYIFYHFLSHGMLHSSYIDLLVDPGACIIYKKHSRMRLSAPDGPVRFDTFHLRGDISDLMRKYDLRFNQVYYPTDSPAVSQLMRSMEKEFLYPGACPEDFFAAQVTALLLTLTKNTLRPCALSADLALHERLEFARKHIRENFAQAWDTNAVAAHVGMRPAAFTAAYKHLFGITPKQEHLACRIAHAKSLLLQRNYIVAQVASLCGYASAESFRRQFKAQTGATPGKFIYL